MLRNVFAGEGVSAVVIVNHGAPAISMAVDPGASCTGPVKSETIALQRSDEVSDRSVAKQVSEPPDIVHTVTATAGSSMISLGASVGTRSPWARRDSIYSSVASRMLRKASSRV